MLSAIELSVTGKVPLLRRGLRGHQAWAGWNGLLDPARDHREAAGPVHGEEAERAVEGDVHKGDLGSAPQVARRCNTRRTRV